MDRQPLDFERLDVYRCAIELLALCVRLAARMPRGHADLRDQLRRAATSIPLNLAEASGKTSGPDRARFHAIARGSALECAAILDVLVLLGAAPAAGDAEHGKLLVSRVVAMLDAQQDVPLTGRMSLSRPLPRPLLRSRPRVRPRSRARARTSNPVLAPFGPPPRFVLDYSRDFRDGLLAARRSLENHPDFSSWAP